MLPIYKAISFQKIIDKGGRTKPWLVLVDTGHDVKPYVVKMFEPGLIHERDSVTNEVLGNVLAKEFDLPVPKAALIEMDENFRMTIQGHGPAEVFDLKDKRIKFGTELLDGFIQMNTTAFTAAQAKRMIHIDELFAFDNLIRNRDRKFDVKQNLLVNKNKAFLIDHELGFEIDDDTLNEFKIGDWNNSFFKYHLFYRYLKNSRKKSKNEYFETFGEHLKRLNINILNTYFSQLIKYGYSRARHKMIKDYLKEMKTNSGNFVLLLRSFIQ